MAFDGKLASLRTYVKAKGLRYAATKLKNEFPPREVRKYFKLLSREADAAWHIGLFGIPFPRQIEDLRTALSLAWKSLDREVAWNILAFEHYRVELGEFLHLQREFDAAFTLSNGTRSLEILDQLEEKFGFSLWSIRNRIIVLEEFKGLETHKQYSQRITGNESVNGIVRVLVAHYSILAEANVTFPQYTASFNKLMEDAERLKVSKSLVEYLQFQLHFWQHATPRLSDYARAFAWAEDTALIDRYETFVRLAAIALARDDASAGIFRDAIAGLQDHIPDARFSALLQKLREFKANSPTSTFDECCDLYTRGEYRECLERAVGLLKAHPALCETLELIARAALRVGDEPTLVLSDRTLAGKVVAGMYGVMAKGSKTFESTQQLFKILAVHQAKTWSNSLALFLLRETESTDPAGEALVRRMAKYTSVLFNPRYASRLSADSQPGVTRRMFALADLDRPAMPEEFAELAAISCVETRRLKVLASIEERAHHLERALVLYRQLAQEENPLDYVDGIKGMIRCQLAGQNLDQCMAAIVDAYYRNSNVVAVLPIKRLLAEVEVLAPDFGQSFDQAIVSDIAHKIVEPDRSLRRAFACESVLAAFGVDKPTLLRDKLESPNQRRVISFLHDVCVEEVLDELTAFDGPEDIGNERIGICQILTDIDGKNAQTYAAEIRAITQRLVVQRSLRQIEESKIYVDVDSFKRNAERDITDRFVRFQALKSLPMQAPSSEYITISMDGKEFGLPKNEASNLFASITLDLRNRFALNGEYGLDGYLSVRIRHGVLENALRKAFELGRLLSKRDADGEYAKNEYWSERFEDIHDQTRAKALRALEALSGQVDDLVNQANSWVQIRTETRDISTGLFDFRFYTNELEHLEGEATRAGSFQDLLTLMLEAFWRKTEAGLAEVKARFHGDLKMAFLKAIDDSLKTLDSVHDVPEIRDLRASLASARTEIQYAIDYTASWFQISVEKQRADLDLDIVVQMAIEGTQNVHPHKHISKDIAATTGKVVRGQMFQPFVEILFILLDNAVKYGRDTYGTVELKMSVDASGPLIRVNVENFLREDEDVKGLWERVQKIRDVAVKASDPDRVTTERGTGLYKIAKLIRADLKSKGTVDIELPDEKQYSITVTLEAASVLA